MRSARRVGAVVAGATLATALTMAATAWACIAGPTLNVAPATVKPGQQVTLTGFSYSSSLPIVVRFNAFDGPSSARSSPKAGGSAILRPSRAR